MSDNVLSSRMRWSFRASSRELRWSERSGVSKRGRDRRDLALVSASPSGRGRFRLLCFALSLLVHIVMVVARLSLLSVLLGFAATAQGERSEAEVAESAHPFTRRAAQNSSSSSASASGTSAASSTSSSASRTSITLPSYTPQASGAAYSNETAKALASKLPGYTYNLTEEVGQLSGVKHASFD